MADREIGIHGRGSKPKYRKGDFEILQFKQKMNQTKNLKKLQSEIRCEKHGMILKWCKPCMEERRKKIERAHQRILKIKNKRRGPVMNENTERDINIPENYDTPQESLPIKPIEGKNTVSDKIKDQIKDIIDSIAKKHKINPGVLFKKPYLKNNDFIEARRDAIKTIINQIGLTQKQLAKEIGVSKSVVNDYARGTVGRKKIYMDKKFEIRSHDDDNFILVLDFSDHTELLEELKKRAEKNFRSPVGESMAIIHFELANSI